MVTAVGHVKNREDKECREIVKATARFSFTRIFCLDNRANKWEEVRPNLFEVTTAVENVPSRPAPANIANGPEVIR